MLRFRLRWLASALAVAGLLFAPPALFAQATTGELAGRVLDSGGAVVPGATITVQNPATGFSRSTVTNNAGEYLVTLLQPGRYTVSAELGGFRKVVRPDIEINLGTRHTLGFELSPGNITEDLVVSGVPPLVERARGPSWPVW